ncbi:MAG: drug resistance transporter, EmrB/QacA subfamily [Acidimicrobiaceae bacterium]|nr:drug resistance transporter, EmrB/QacA subfamily [Acidimicrobiaceae bacterium]
MSAHQRETLAVTCVGSFMVLLDVSIVNTALPSIQRAVHASFSGLQWVVDAYTLSFAVLLLSCGALADRHGRKRMFQAGMAVFSIGSLLCGLSTTGAELDGARVLQGVGGAALATSSLALLATAFHDPRQRVRAVSLWAAISGMALGVGPTVGGALVVSAGWRWVFFLNVPIGAGCALFGVRVLAESRDPAGRRVDVAGQLTSIAWLALLTYGFIELGSHPWASARVWAPLATAGVLLALFLAVEHRSDEPMLPLGLFRSRLFSTTALVTFLVGFVLLSVPFFTVQYFQGVQHLSALASGVRVLAFTLMFSLSAPAGRLARQFGFRVPVAIGGLAGSAGLLSMTQITPGSGYADIWWRLSLVGLGFGLMLSPLSAAALAAVDHRRAGLASSVANTTRQVGTVVGIALLGALVQTQASRSAASALHGLPQAAAGKLAADLSRGGAQVALPSSLPLGLSPARFHAIGADAYVSGIHAAFAVDALVLLAAALVAGALLRTGRRAAVAAVEPEPVTARSEALRA